MVLPRIRVNERPYGPVEDPVVVVCIDGSEPAYHEEAIEAGCMPSLKKIAMNGSSLLATSAMPSFTNPNNLSIATGVPSSEHGICGNFFFDRENGEEVMMNDPKWLRVPTLFAAYEEHGAEVAVVTAKDKLRRLLGAGLKRAVCFSAECSDQVTWEENGIEGVLDLVDMPLPSVYSSELSELVLATGTELLRRKRPDLMYLSLTDYVQHKHAPGTGPANDFYAMLDRYFGRLDGLGCVLVVTGDHGMKAKSSADGRPKVVYLQQLLDDWLGSDAARVILPITDPYTVHHSALGSFATVYLPPGAHRDDVRCRIASLSGVAFVLSAEDACARFDLPADRVGDLIVIAEGDTALGTTRDRHDLAQLDEPLRSHGGLTEQTVPFIVNRTLSGIPENHVLRNYDAYWVAVNFTSNSG